MAEAYLGEIRMFSGNYAPQGWELCNGQLLNINRNQALFAVMGTAYGGDGITTFGLPDLRGRAPVHVSTNLARGATGGAETVTLTQANLPPHTHAAAGNKSGAGSSIATGNFWAVNAERTTYVKPSETVLPNITFNTGAIAPAGAGQPHNNMMPFMPVSFIIATIGLFPTPD